MMVVGALPVPMLAAAVVETKPNLAHLPLNLQPQGVSMIPKRPLWVTISLLLSVVSLLSLSACGVIQSLTGNVTVVEILSKDSFTESTQEIVPVQHCQVREQKQVSCSAGKSSNFSLGVGAGVGAGVDMVADGSIDFSANTGADLGLDQSSGQSLVLEDAPPGYIRTYTITKKFTYLNGKALVALNGGQELERDYVFQASCDITVQGFVEQPCPAGNLPLPPSPTPSPAVSEPQVVAGPTNSLDMASLSPPSTPTVPPNQGVIVLQAQGDWGGLETVVQWQDSTKSWNDVDTWRGNLDSFGRIQWLVEPENFNAGPFRWQVSQPNGTVLFESEAFYLPASGEIYTIEINSTRPTPAPQSVGPPPDGPQGQLAWVTNEYESTAEVAVFNFETETIARLTTNIADDWAPALSPDGQWLAYVSNYGGQADIYLMPAAGGAATQLTTHATPDDHPTWSGAKLIFASQRAGNWDIYAINRDGSGLQQLTSHSATDIYPAASPDGRKIAFVSERNGLAHLYLMNTDGSNITPLVTSLSNISSISWSPDSQRLIFVGVEEANTQQGRLYTVRVDGSQLQTFLPDAGLANYPAWSPDGYYVAYVRSVRQNNQDWGHVYYATAQGKELGLLYAPQQASVWSLNWRE